MLGVLEGFATLAAVIALGAFLAHVRILQVTSQVMLARLSFFVASPALMLIVMSDADIGALFSANLAASTTAVAVSGTIYLVVSRRGGAGRCPRR